MQPTSREIRQFETYFGTSLTDYWGKNGLDVTKFEEELLGVPDGTSTNDALAFYAERAGFAAENVKSFVHSLAFRVA